MGMATLLDAGDRFVATEEIAAEFAPWRPPSAAAEDDSDEALLARHLRGERRAFERLVKRYRADLLVYLRRTMKDAAAAEDVTQETFLRLHRAADQFEPHRGLRPWLFSIASNAARDCYRYHARRPATSLQAPARSGDPEGMTLAAMQEGDAEAPHARLERHELQEQIRRIIDRMPAHLREILTLAYFRQLSYNEMSESLGIPLGTVKSRLHAAVANFAERWGRQRHCA
jgi:RNA polymerase sigma-70 factor, ECF subfamily